MASVFRMPREAESEVSADKVRQEFLEAGNKADALARPVERALTEHANTSTANDRTEGRAALDSVRIAVAL